LVEWVTPEFEPGVRACFEELSQIQAAREVVLTVDFPVMFWNGRDDPYHDPMQAFAAANGLPFLSGAGDHVAAVLRPSAEAVKGIRSFVGLSGLSC
jgi:hypothetical protein